MKTIIKSVLITIVFVNLLSCSKENMMIGDVDINKYEKSLSNDYSNALNYHNSLSSKSVEFDQTYYRKMYHSNDSLFSDHFYEFCQDMMKNSGMMGISGNMMGNNSNMMGGNNSMMNGNIMGSHNDMIEMMAYMDSVHTLTGTLKSPDFYLTDSLMYRQMSICKMMNPQTDGINKLFSDMQALRNTHIRMHGI